MLASFLSGTGQHQQKCAFAAFVEVWRVRRGSPDPAETADRRSPLFSLGLHLRQCISWCIPLKPENTLKPSNHEPAPIAVVPPHEQLLTTASAYEIGIDAERRKRYAGVCLVQTGKCKWPTMRKSFLIVLVVWLASLALGFGISSWFDHKSISPPTISRPSAFDGLIESVAGPIMYFVLFMLVVVIWGGPLVLIMILFIPKEHRPVETPIRDA